MPKIPESEIKHLKISVSLLSLCRSRGIRLKKVGKTYKGRCPFHEEESASFTVNPETNLFHCFGCGKAGNNIQLVQYLDNISFPEAFRKLGGESNKKEPVKAIEKAVKRKKGSISSRTSCAHFFLTRHKLLSLTSDETCSESFIDTIVRIYNVSF